LFVVGGVVSGVKGVETEEFMQIQVFAGGVGMSNAAAKANSRFLRVAAE
jgi:hypothetical protein